MKIIKKELIFVGPSDTIDLIENSNIIYKNKIIKNYNISGYISKIRKQNFPYKKYKYLGDDLFFKKKILKSSLFINNIYSNSSRKRLFNLSKASNYITPSVVYKNALLFSNIKIGPSNIIYPNVTISTNSVVKTGNVINYDCLIGHDVQIGNFNFIGPGCKILGEVKIGNNSFIGSNVKIMPKVKIGNNVNINAGLTIYKDINNNNSVMNVNNYRYLKLKKK